MVDAAACCCIEPLLGTNSLDDHAFGVKNASDRQIKPPARTASSSSDERLMGGGLDLEVLEGWWQQSLALMSWICL